MKTWIDHRGVTRPTPQIAGRLKFRIPLHASLRAFVFIRDSFTCQRCGVKGENVPKDYDGSSTISCANHCLVMDHHVSRRNGGSHHPSNLVTLCDSCNSRKVGLEDKGSR